MYIYIYIYMYFHIYIYMEREGERETDGERERERAREGKGGGCTAALPSERSPLTSFMASMSASSVTHPSSRSCQRGNNFNDPRSVSQERPHPLTLPDGLLLDRIRARPTESRGNIW